MAVEVEVSVRDLRNHTRRVMGEIEGGTTVYLTKHGERIAKITPLRPTTWADHVHEVLGDAEPYDSGLADLLADDDRVSAKLEAAEHASASRDA